MAPLRSLPLNLRQVLGASFYLTFYSFIWQTGNKYLVDLSLHSAFLLSLGTHSTCLIHIHSSKQFFLYVSVFYLTFTVDASDNYRGVSILPEDIWHAV